MNVFVTGASGFIGSHLLHHLISRGWSVRCLLHRRHIPPLLECETIWGDVTDYSSIRSAIRGSDLLFHLAAALGSKPIRKETLLKINLIGTENVLRAAREAGVKRIIHFSSAGVLGRVPRGEKASEDYPLQPQTPYDWSKTEGERMALRFAQNGISVVILRPGWVYGPADRRTFKLIQAIFRKRFILVTRGQTEQTPIYIDDLIQGVLLCAEKGRQGEIYHLAGEEALSVKAMVQAIAASVNRKIPRLSFPELPVKTAAWVADKIFSVLRKESPLSSEKLAFFIHPKPLSIQKSRKELGFSPSVGFKKGIAQSVSWYREKGWL